MPYQHLRYALTIWSYASGGPALDQIGAVIGPLTVAGMLAVTGGDYAPALGVLALPGAAALALLVWLRWWVPEPADYEHGTVQAGPAVADNGGRLPRAFWRYCGFTALTMTGFATFGLLSFHLVTRGLLPAAAVPVLYAAAMGADALAALASGWCYDRFGANVLVTVPILSAATALVAFTGGVAEAVVGALLWGAAVGVQESTLRAAVADMVAPGRRASAYGVFAAGLGAATAVGGALTGWLYDFSVGTLGAVVVGIQLLAVVAAVTFGVCSDDSGRRSADRRRADMST